MTPVKKSQSIYRDAEGECLGTLAGQPLITKAYDYRCGSAHGIKDPIMRMPKNAVLRNSNLGL